MMISKPFATIKNKKGAGIETRPAVVSGIVTGEAPALTVPEASGKVNSAQFPSRHGTHAV